MLFIELYSAAVTDPFHKDHDAQPPKEGDQEDHLGDELTQDANSLHKERVIDDRQHNAKYHVDNTNNDGDLHLVAVLEVDLVYRNLPHWVKSNRIGRPLVDVPIFRVQCNLIPRFKVFNCTIRIFTNVPR